MRMVRWPVAFPLAKFRVQADGAPQWTFRSIYRAQRKLYR
jgi:hypothetical protein